MLRSSPRIRLLPAMLCLTTHKREPYASMPALQGLTAIKIRQIQPWASIVTIDRSSPFSEATLALNDRVQRANRATTM